MEKVIIKFDGKFYLEKEFYDFIGKIGKINEKIYLEPEEVLYILEKEWGLVDFNGNKLNKREFLEKFLERINYKLYLVLKDIRDLGYYFDIYDGKIILHERGFRNKPIYLIYPVFENEILNWKKILDLLEEAKKINCELLLGIIDFEYKIVYYKISEKKF